MAGLKIGSIKTGMQSTLKVGSDNALDLAERQLAEEKQSMDRKEAKGLGTSKRLFKTVGEEVFNVYSEAGTPISFTSGRFIALADDQDVLDTLQYFVKKRRIVEVTETSSLVNSDIPSDSEGSDEASDFSAEEVE